MSSKSESTAVIQLKQVGKIYQLYKRPIDRLWHLIYPKRKNYQEFQALKNINLELFSGQTLGIIGSNGAGKSTLLKTIAQVLTPTTGQVTIKGRVAALLELGAGFNPEFTGRENIFFTAGLLGLSKNEIDARIEAIIEFSGLRSFIDQAVKTYSSGMYVRLAFSIATSINPDILIIDEALSVGDAEFSRKSFDKIMALKESGVTILFCSHALYQIEVLCDHVIWLDHGEIMFSGPPKTTIAAYEKHLATHNSSSPEESLSTENQLARITQVDIEIDGKVSKALTAESQVSKLTINAHFNSRMDLPCPSVAILIFAAGDILITSFCTQHDGIEIQRDLKGFGVAQIEIPKIPLLKGHYWIDVLLLCERTIHMYDSARKIATIDVIQNSLEQGYVKIEHTWKVDRTHV